MEKVFLLTFTAACALSDVQTGKIPNPLILCGILCGAAGRLLASAPAALQPVALQPAALQPAVLQPTPLDPAMLTPSDFTPAVLMDGAAGFLLPYLILGIPFFLQMLGGGDLKLLSVIGLVLGTRGSFRMLFLSLTVGAVLSLGIVLRKGNLLFRLGCLARYADEVRKAGKMIPYHPEGDDGSGRFPFAAAVFPALAVYLVWGAG